MTHPTSRLPAPQRRAQIVAAATDVFVDVGYRAASLRDIAARAGISHTALRRYFASKGEILLAIHEQYEADTLAAIVDRGELTVDRWMIALAEEGSADPQRLRVFTALAGEGTSPTHPAHAAARRSYELRRAAFTAGLERGVNEGVVAPDRANPSQAVRLSALWNGAQLLQQYLPAEVSTPALIRAESVRLRHPVPRAPQRTATTPAAVGDTVTGSGSARRDAIIDAATALLLTHGYSGTSMQAFATGAGIAKATLFHHYATKDDLVHAVLHHSAEVVGALATTENDGSGAERLRALPTQWQAMCAGASDLVRLHVVLIAEATSAAHPLHVGFREHLSELIASARAAARAAVTDREMRDSADPDAEGLRLIALWEGLQLISRYDESIDVAAELNAHLDELLITSGSSADPA